MQRHLNLTASYHSYVGLQQRTFM